jgi:dTDP-4-amino-4,6-dideoxygalactose transaminase
MSGTAVTKEFEKEFSAWMNVPHALGFNNGTAALLAAMFGCGVGTGDEIICPALTYWASALPCFALGATPVFAEIDPETLCIDPKDIEKRISPRTKVIVVVHYFGHPADMDSIMEIARRRGLKVIEDVSHAHGGLYKGRKVGSFGDAAGYSLMTGKSLAVGEAGMLTTSSLEVYERAIAWGHYERYTSEIKTPGLKPSAGLPLGGGKGRMHQLSAAVGRVQLRHYDRRSAEIRLAMNYFWDGLEGVPGIRAHRVDEKTGSTMGGWYGAHGFYRSEELGGLSVSRFCEALRAEGVSCSPGCNRPLHRHPIFNETDIYRQGKPTRIAHAATDVRQPKGSLPITEAIGNYAFSIPWFKHLRRAEIDEYIQAFRKVAASAKSLLAGDTGNPEQAGGWSTFVIPKS